MDETPSVGPVATLGGNKIRPAALRWLTLAQVGFSIAGRLMPHTPSKSPATYIAILVVSATIEICVFVGFWRGRNLARILVLAGCALDFLALPLIGHLFTITKIFCIIHALFDGYLVYWLTRKPIVAFFKAPGDATSRPIRIVPESSSSRPLGLE